jgi:hypothetical protein
MAGEPGYTATFYIYPSTASFTATAVDNRGRSLGTYSSSSLSKTTRNGQSCYYIFFESTDGVILTINTYGQTYTASSVYGVHDFDVTITNTHPSKLYAWGASNELVYTDKSSPALNDTVYDNTGTSIGSIKTVTGPVFKVEYLENSSSNGSKDGLLPKA